MASRDVTPPHVGVKVAALAGAALLVAPLERIVLLRQAGHTSRLVSLETSGSMRAWALGLWIVRSQGLAALWRGAALYAARASAPLAFGATMFPPIRNTAESAEARVPLDATPTRVARVCIEQRVLPHVAVAAALYPLELAHTRIAVSSSLGEAGAVGTRLRRALVSWGAGGTVSLTPGLVLTLAHVSLNGALVFAGHFLAREWKLDPSRSLQERFGFSYAVVLAAETVTYPLDTLRRQRMLAGSLASPPVAASWRGRVGALFRGATVNVSRSLIGAAVLTCGGFYAPERYA